MKTPDDATPDEASSADTDGAEVASSLDAALRMIREGYRGTLQFDEHFIPIKYVIDPERGRLALPVMVAMLRAAETILFIPEEAEDSLQTLVTLEAMDEHDALADRWRTYHGEPDDVRWASVWLDMAKLQGVVIDGDSLMRPNPLVACEARLCKFINEQVDALRRLARSRGGMEIESPLCVGVDGEGFDVRARFDIVRIRFDEPTDDERDARARIAHMLEEAP